MPFGSYQQGHWSMTLTTTDFLGSQHWTCSSFLASPALPGGGGVGVQGGRQQAHKPLGTQSGLRVCGGEGLAQLQGGQEAHGNGDAPTQDWCALHGMHPDGIPIPRRTASTSINASNLS